MTKLKDTYPLYLANEAQQPNADLEVTDKYTGKVAFRVAQADAKTIDAGIAAAVDAAEDEGDELLPAAVDVVLETGQASVSMLQRRLKLGYSRAARLVDQMEQRGIVGPFEGSKPRQLLITKEKWQEMQMGGQSSAAPQPDAPPFDEASPEEE